MILDEDKYVEAIIIVFCIVAVGIGLSYSTPQTNDYQAWISDYPKQASVGSAIDFTLWLQGQDLEEFTADVYVDDILIESREVLTAQQTSENIFSVPGDALPSAATYKITVKLYNPEQTLYTEGSRFVPYQLFFYIDVV